MIDKFNYALLVTKDVKKIVAFKNDKQFQEHKFTYLLFADLYDNIYFICDGWWTKKGKTAGDIINNDQQIIIRHCSAVKLMYTENKDAGSKPSQVLIRM